MQPTEPKQTMCAWCKRIKMPGGKWRKSATTPVLRLLNHGICMKCAVEFFGTPEKKESDPD